jgi:hypothetical protein
MLSPGSGALVLVFDIEQDALQEHDHWHTHEHLPERLGMAGFLLGTRWTSVSGASPRYLAFYEVAHLDVLSSPAYLARLNNPTPWNAKMMKRYIGMRRAICNVVSSAGFGVGHHALLVRFAPSEGGAERLREWLSDSRLTSIAARPGLSSAHLLESGRKPEVTREQIIRGGDAGLQSVLLVTGYDRASVAELEGAELGRDAFVAHGATEGVASGIYELAHLLSKQELPID